MTREGVRTDELIAVCRKHILPPTFGVVVPEPYIPHVPPDWNGALVLAEAQNLSNTYRSYRDALLRWPPEVRITRLGRRTGLDVHPWDDGWLKLAVHVAFGLHPDKTAVSNAVLWSQVDANGANATPSSEMQDRSAIAWKELLAILKPKHVITAGKKSYSILGQVTTGSATQWRHTALVFPAAPNVSRWLKDHEVTSLLAIYPEVAEARRERAEWFQGNTGHKTLFACHAVEESARMRPSGPPTIRLQRLARPEQRLD
jgi:hypothetical protein